MSLLRAELFTGRAKKARISSLLRTTPGEPRSMRKFDIVSNASPGALSESCNHEAGTKFLCHRGTLGSNDQDVEGTQPCKLKSFAINKQHRN